MNQNGKAKFASRFPNRNETLIIDVHQLASVVCNVQPERLPDLESLCAACFLYMQSLRRPLWELIAQLLPLPPIHTAKDLKAFRRAFFKMFEMGIENIFTPATIKVNIMSNACFIEQVKEFAERLLIPTTAEWITKMIVRINDGKLRFVHQSGFGYEL